MDLQNCLADKLRERDLLTAHVACLTNQNAELSKELSCFVQQDECLRAQLDRRNRIECLEKKNFTELATSHSRVAEARSRSPVKVIREYVPVAMPVPVCAPVHYSPSKIVEHRNHYNHSPCRSPYKY